MFQSPPTRIKKAHWNHLEQSQTAEPKQRAMPGSADRKRPGAMTLSRLYSAQVGQLRRGEQIYLTFMAR